MADSQERDTPRGPDGDPAADGADETSRQKRTHDQDQDSDQDHSHGHDQDSDQDHSHDQDQDSDQDHSHDQEHDHDHHSHDVEHLGVAVLTVSTSRTIDSDPSGDAIVELLGEAGHEVATRDLVNDDYDGVQSTVNALVGRKDVDAVVTTGGTGITPDDVTVEAVRPLFGKELPGFGELFRRLSYEEIGTHVVGTRAVAGVADGVPVFCLPGSENAARLGVSEIIVEEGSHLAGLAGRDRGDEEDEEGAEDDGRAEEEADEEGAEDDGRAEDGSADGGAGENGTSH